MSYTRLGSLVTLERSVTSRHALHAHMGDITHTRIMRAKHSPPVNPHEMSSHRHSRFLQLVLCFLGGGAFAQAIANLGVLSVSELHNRARPSPMHSNNVDASASDSIDRKLFPKATGVDIVRSLRHQNDEEQPEVRCTTCSRRQHKCLSVFQQKRPLKC